MSKKSARLPDSLRACLDSGQAGEDALRAWDAASEEERREFLEQWQMDVLLAETLREDGSESARREPAGKGRALSWRSGLLVKVTAAAAVLMIAVGIGLHSWRPQQGYPEPAGSGDFVLVSAAGQPRTGQLVVRGDTMEAGPGGARLDLGGYCELSLSPRTSLVVTGWPGVEIAELREGKVRCRITPGRGEFGIVTPQGSLRVLGRESETAVEYSLEKGGSSMGSLVRSTVVKVAVVSGLVAYHFGSEEGVLSAGMNKVFADDGAKAIEAGKPTYRSKGGHAAWKEKGRIVGKVSNCPGCEMDALDADGKIVASSRVKKGGKVYEVEWLKPGKYTLRVSARGREPLVIEGLEVKVNNDLWVNLEF